MKIISHKSARLLVIFLVLLSAVVVALSLRQQENVKGYKTKLLASGETLSLEKLAPRPVPPGQNRAAAFLELTNLLDRDVALSFLVSNPPPAMRLVAPGKAMIGWKRPVMRNGPVTNTWEETQAAVEQTGKALLVLHSLINSPTLAFEVNYRQGPSLLLPHLVPLKVSAELLSAAALCDLHRGDTASAVTDARSMLALVKATKDEPLVISQLVRIAIAYLAFNVNWELLQASDLTEEQLAALQHDWVEAEFVPPAEHALLMERAMVESALARLRQSRRPFREMTGSARAIAVSNSAASNWLEHVTELSKTAWQGTKLKTEETLWRYSWSYSDELRALKGGRVLLDTMRLAQTSSYFKDALREQEDKLDALGFSALPRDTDSPVGSDLAATDIRWFFSKSIRSLEDYPRRIMTIEAARQMAITAIALKRYQLKQGNYPPDLSSLVPEWLPAIPRDPVDGKPMRYQSAGKAFLLYSVGDDGVDNGGDPAPETAAGPFSWSNGRDYVWPQPATEREILADEQKLTIKRD